MRKTILVALAILVYVSSSAQVFYKEIASSRLNSERKLKIKLPKDYDPKADEKYPVIIVFDGDYLFEPVAGQVDFQTYFDDMPSSIVVGIMQGENRFYDAYFDPATGLPTESGLRFHDFVSDELLPYIDKNYNTSKFRVAVGHDRMGNFINSYLYKENLVFQAYVCISPDFVGSLNNFISKRLALYKDDIFYYLATAEKDIPAIRESIISTDTQIAAVKNQNLTYYFDDFENDTHYTLVTGAISRSFDKIFNIYNPLREKELEEKVLPYEGTLDQFLTDRYKRIEKLFGIKQEISEEELEKVAKVAEQREDFESLYKLGKLANKIHPETLLGTYYLAQSAEQLGKTKKAKKLYESALVLNDALNIDKDYIATKIEELAVSLVDVDDEDLEELEEEDDNENE
ncbi:alpha/beta hydrolase [Winogradskyella bathintestinalis]|uniref:Alpha/beta hydrolase-fold protein n=1 Tax=Winogradskyella bathintestinalis TaxID=3035208 RepID=A0ABT7ZS29_9FLAO|nr:alpha/beta hydrolase-fold protein [Winogradskyella bathintestinalis]MDN3491793.1 alpha/beta hydrolase-fold protein [Winogradskyella bathintestinalis]